MKNQANLNNTEISRHSCGIAKQFARQESKMEARLRGHDNNRENGNVLVIVLISIILLAALTFTFMKGDSASNKSTLTKGEAKIAASNILKYAKSVENAVKSLQLVSGCSESEISFENAIESGYANVNAPSECWVFGAQGGGLTWQSPADNVNDGSEWFYTDTSIPDIGSGENELLIALPYVSRDLCLEVNRHVGLTNTGGEPPQDLAVAYDNNKFTGTFPSDKNLSDPPDVIDGNKTGCFEGGGGPAVGTYHFFHVLIAR